MIPAKRRQKIQTDIEAKGAAQIKELSRKYGVSEMTIRRDLKTLEEKGQVQRTHGGAVRLGRASAEPRYLAKQKVRGPQKREIAKWAAEELVEDGDVIVLEGGTTVTAMVEHLESRQDLTIVTNGLHTMNELQPFLSKRDVICCGGLLRDVSFTFVGPVAEGFFQEFHANTAFLSATGWTRDAGFTDPSMLETQVKKGMAAASNRTIMLLDSSKLGVRSLSTAFGAEDVDLLVTDKEAPASMVASLRKQGISVQQVTLTSPVTVTSNV